MRFVSKSVRACVRVKGRERGRERERERERKRERERESLNRRCSRRARSRLALSFSHTLESSALTHHAELDYSIARWCLTGFLPLILTAALSTTAN